MRKLEEEVKVMIRQRNCIILGIVLLLVVGLSLRFAFGQETMSVEEYVNRGNAYVDKGDYDSAIEMYNKAIALNPNYADAYYRRGIMYDDAKRDYERAIADFTKVIELKPNYANAYYSRALTRFKKYKATSAQGLNTIKIPKQGFFIDLGEKCGSVLALVYQKDNLDFVVDDCTRAIEIDPSYFRAYNIRAQAFLLQVTAEGRGEVQSFDPVEGTISFRDLPPECQSAYLEKLRKRQQLDPANVYLSDRNILLSLALADSNRAIEISPESPRPYVTNAQIYEVLGRKFEAFQAYQKFFKWINLDPSLQRSPQEIETIKNRIGALGRDLLADIEKTIAANPNDPQAYFQRGLVYALFEQDRAIYAFTKAIAINQKYAEALYYRGATYSAKGNYDLAIADFNKVIELNPNYTDAYYQKAAACEMAGRFKEAVEAYQKFIEIVPPQYEFTIYVARERIKELQEK